MGTKWYLRDCVVSQGLCGISVTMWYLRDSVVSKGLCGI